MESIDIAIDNIKNKIERAKKELDEYWNNGNNRAFSIEFRLEGEIKGLQEALEVVEKHKLRENFLDMIDEMEENNELYL